MVAHKRKRAALQMSRSESERCALLLALTGNVTCLRFPFSCRPEGSDAGSLGHSKDASIGVYVYDARLPHWD